MTSVIQHMFADESTIVRLGSVPLGTEIVCKDETYTVVELPEYLGQVLQDMHRDGLFKNVTWVGILFPWGEIIPHADHFALRLKEGVYTPTGRLQNPNSVLLSLLDRAIGLERILILTELRNRMAESGDIHDISNPIPGLTIEERKK